MAYAGMGYGGFKLPDITVAKDFAALEYMEAQKDALQNKATKSDYNAFKQEAGLDQDLSEMNNRSYTFNTMRGLDMAMSKGADPEATINVIGGSYTAGVKQLDGNFKITRDFDNKVLDGSKPEFMTRENLRAVSRNQGYRSIYSQGYIEALPSGGYAAVLPLEAGLRAFGGGLLKEEQLVPIGSDGAPVKIEPGQKLPSNVVGFKTVVAGPPMQDITIKSSWRDGAKKVAETAGRKTIGKTNTNEDSLGVTITSGNQVVQVERENLMTLTTNNLFKGAAGFMYTKDENKESAGLIKNWAGINDLTPEGRDAFEEITAVGGQFGDRFSTKIWSELTEDERAEVGSAMYNATLVEAGAQVDFSQIDRYSRTVQDNSRQDKRNKLTFTDQEIEVGKTDFTLVNPKIKGVGETKNAVYGSIVDAMGGGATPAPLPAQAKVVYVGKFDERASGVTAVPLGNDATKNVEINSFGIIQNADGSYDVAFRGSVMSGNVAGKAVIDVPRVVENTKEFGLVKSEPEVDVVPGQGSRRDFGYISFNSTDQQTRDIFSTFLSANGFRDTREFVQFVLGKRGIGATAAVELTPEQEAQESLDEVFQESSNGAPQGM